MKNQILITDIHTRKVLDSWGNPTFEVEVETEEGVTGKAIAPRERNEEANKRDALFCSPLGRLKNKNINTVLAKEMVGMSVLDQVIIDGSLKHLSEVHGESSFDKKVTLATSMAAARAAAKSLGISLHQYIGGISGSSIPSLMMNVISSNKQVDNSMNISEFMIVPQNTPLFSERLQMCVEVYRKLKEIILEKGLNTAVGDEGGFCPNLNSDYEALDIIMLAIENAGYKDHFYISLGVNADKMYQNGKYHFGTIGNETETNELINLYKDMVNKYPILSIEDGLAKGDIEGWKKLTVELGDKVYLIANEIFSSSTEKLSNIIQEKIGNGVLIKLCQIGTVTEAISTIKIAKANGYMPIISHSSGETEDSFIADFAVALNLKYIKGGAPIRSENMVKYNQLLRIEEELV